MNASPQTCMHSDLTIVGGGLVGASLAAALAPLGKRITIIESFPINVQLTEDFDARAIALSYGGQRIFSGIGIWSALAAFATPIKNIHVSDRGRFGFSHLSAKKSNVEALGYVIEMQYLTKALHDYLNQFDNVERLQPATLHKFSKHNERMHIEIKQEGKVQQLTTDLLIAADGGNSLVREQNNIATTVWDYKQHAIVANVGLTRSHNNMAYERFTSTGPLAMLPLTGDRVAMVLTVQSTQSEVLMNLSQQEFLTYLQQRFGYRLGKLIKIGKRHTFPLQMRCAQEQSGDGFIILGNAAHSLHPVTGQGFNLSLRDVAVLAEVLCDTWQMNQPLACDAVYERYQAWRKQDQRKLIMLTDGITRLFSNDFIPLTTVRNFGLVALDLLTPLKTRVSRHAMGYVGYLPRLAVGEALA